MLPRVPAGYQVRLLAVAGSLDELDNFVPLEGGLPEPSRVLLQIGISGDAYAKALELNNALLAQGVPYWPEHPGIVAFSEGDTIFIAWMKGFAWMPLIIGLLFGLPLILPIILWFVDPGFRQTMEAMVGFLVMMVMMIFMMRMTREMTTPAKPKEELIPFAERMETRLASVGESIGKLEASLAGLETTIGETTRLVKEAPEMVKTTAEKEKVSRETRKIEKDIERKLREYEESLTLEQRAKLEEERRLIEELQKVGGS